MTSEINFTNSTLNTKNITVSGQTQFSNLPTCSVVPTIGEEFVNKGYVDSLVGQYSGGYNMFFNYSVTDGSYKQLGNTIVDVSQNQIDITTTDSTRQLVEQFVSSALNITTIPVGIWNVLLVGTINSTAGNVRYSCDIHTLDGFTLSAVLASSNPSQEINAVTGPAAYTMNITLPTAVACSLTAKLVVRLFVQNFGLTMPLTVSTYFQNIYYSYIQTSLNEGTTLLTSNNNWSGSNTFQPIPASNILYSTITGTPAGTIGNIIVGTTTGTTFNSAVPTSTINITRNGVYLIHHKQAIAATGNSTILRFAIYFDVKNNLGNTVATLLGGNYHFGAGVLSGYGFHNTTSWVYVFNSVLGASQPWTVNFYTELLFSGGGFTKGAADSIVTRIA